MRKAAKQIGICAGALILICLINRFFFARSYTAHIPAHFPVSSDRADDPGARPRLKREKEEIVRLEKETWKDDHLSVEVIPEKPGETELRVVDPEGQEIGMYLFRVGRFHTVYDLQTGGFNGDSFVMASVSLFWFLVSAIMVWHYFQARGPAYYAYSTIYYAGFSIFSLASGVSLLRVTVMHLIDPFSYSMLDAYAAINSASARFMLLTMPLVLLFALAMMISNIELLRHERPRGRNLLGFAVSLLLVGGEMLGLFAFTRDYQGPEWGARLENTLENVYATIFVYFQCMLTGSAICGLTAARRQPEMNRDCLIVLGCWFRKDGTLPPLLKGRVDRAISFWSAQRQETGKTAVIIPSGGQGEDEPMPEAEAMRRYLLARDIPEEVICPETNSVNTYQNMLFSKEIVDRVRPQGKVAYVTTNYHVFRSGLWANLAGLPAEGLGQKTKWWFWPNAFMRECLGLLQKRWRQEILLLVLLLVFFGVLSMILG